LQRRDLRVFACFPVIAILRKDALRLSLYNSVIARSECHSLLSLRLLNLSLRGVLNFVEGRRGNPVTSTCHCDPALAGEAIPW